MLSDKDIVKTVRRLKVLERDWPTGLMLFASGSGGNLILCEGHPQEGGRQIETLAYCVVAALESACTGKAANETD